MKRFVQEEEQQKQEQQGSSKKKRKKSSSRKTADLPLLDEDFFSVAPTVDKDGNPIGARCKGDGRRRQFAHQEGNFPTHVFCVLKPHAPTEFAGIAGKVALTCAETLKGLVTEKGFVCEEQPHISLSRPFALRYHQIQPLVTEITKRLGAAHKFEVCMPRCTLLRNDDGTRVFGALVVEKGCGAVLSLIRSVDSALESFGLQTYYKDPVPHVSVAWALTTTTKEGGGDKTSTALTEPTNKKVAVAFDAEDTACNVEEVCVKSGAYSYSVFLR